MVHNILHDYQNTLNDYNREYDESDIRHYQNFA